MCKDGSVSLLAGQVGRRGLAFIHRTILSRFDICGAARQDEGIHFR
jgi:hypothetical protein